MMPLDRSWLFALLGGLALWLPAVASPDLSLFKAGNTWVYEHSRTTRHTGRLFQSFDGRIEYRLDSLSFQMDTLHFRLTWKVKGVQIDANDDTLRIESERMSNCRIHVNADGSVDFRSDSSWAMPIFATGIDLVSGWQKALYRGDTLLFNRIATLPPCISSTSEFLEGFGLIEERKSLFCGMTSDISHWRLLEFNAMLFNRQDLREINPSTVLRRQKRKFANHQRARWLARGASFNVDGRSLPARRKSGFMLPPDDLLLNPSR